MRTISSFTGSCTHAREKGEAGFKRAEPIDDLEELGEKEPEAQHGTREKDTGCIAPDRSLLANRRSGIIGCSTRYSLKTKNANWTIAIASAMTVTGSPQPAVAELTIP